MADLLMDLLEIEMATPVDLETKHRCDRVKKARQEIIWLRARVAVLESHIRELKQ